MPHHRTPHGLPIPDTDQVQAGVLMHLIDCLPCHLTVAEIVRELADDPDNLGSRDAIENAVRDLAGVGLLHRHGPFAFPTRAATRFAVLSRG